MAHGLCKHLKNDIAKIFSKIIVQFSKLLFAYESLFQSTEVL